LNHKNENFNIETISVTEQIKMNYEEILNLVSDDKTREGLLKTTERASKTMKFLTEDYKKDPK
tara:strand:+ start:154 stop:342 length:189 start_codon:yes stop_codon:yes gene_type:complete